MELTCKTSLFLYFEVWDLILKQKDQKVEFAAVQIMLNYVASSRSCSSADYDTCYVARFH